MCRPVGVCDTVCVFVCICVCLCLCVYCSYAPMSDLGGLLYDKDAVYIDIPNWKVQYSSNPDNTTLANTQQVTEGEQMVSEWTCLDTHAHTHAWSKHAHAHKSDQTCLGRGTTRMRAQGKQT